MNRKDFSENFSALKKCEKIYSIIFWIYALSCIPYACAILIYAFLESLIFLGNILTLIRNFILTLMFFSAGLISVYKKDLKFTWIPVIIAIFSAIISNFNDIFSFFLGISLISSLLLTIIHKKYRWLENQDGFPYFNERFEEQKNNLAEDKSNKQYQKNIEIYKNSSGKMDEI